MSASAVPHRPLPLVSIVLPVYNEADILRQNVSEIIAYVSDLQERYRFEILLINDGSLDESGPICEQLAAQSSMVRALHHPANFGVGQTLKYGFSVSRGDFVVVLDADLSYAPEHIGLLLDAIVAKRAKLVLASAYMHGGRVTNVPSLRRFLSVTGNGFLRVMARGGISTLTCMVRAYDGPFVRSLVLRATSLAIMPEIIFKTMVLNGRIHEVPAHLDWGRQIGNLNRVSSMRIFRHIGSTVVSGFLFRPVLFLILPGLLMLAFSTYTNAWMLIHFFDALAALPREDRTFSQAFAVAYAAHSHTFIVAFLSLMLAVQLIGMGFLSLQAQKYFEELFYLGSTVRRAMNGLGTNSRDQSGRAKE